LVSAPHTSQQNGARHAIQMRDLRTISVERVIGQS
jgi:hypothetical protein